MNDVQLKYLLAIYLRTSLAILQEHDTKAFLSPSFVVTFKKKLTTITDFRPPPRRSSMLTAFFMLDLLGRIT
jgi:hypothetical protein